MFENFDKLPITFEENQGQFPASIHFLARGTNYSLALKEDRAELLFQTDSEKFGEQMQLNFVGADPIKVTGLKKMSGQSNYLIGKDSTQWRTGVANYHSVQYQGIYPGIDLIFYSQQKELEYDFVIAPGADFSNIELAITGDVTRPSIDTEGSLILTNSIGKIIHHKPIIYQNLTDGRRQLIAGSYLIKENGHIGFHIGDYDKQRPLIIDPIISYSTYVSKGGFNKGRSIAVDQQGNIYLTGLAGGIIDVTSGAYQPTGKSNYDTFVVKLNPSGTEFIYATYLGGSGSEEGLGIAIDAEGSAYVTGRTASIDFPVFNAIQPLNAHWNSIDHDAFIAKLDPEGQSLIYASYLGGYNDDVATSIAVDKDNQAYICGKTTSLDFPVQNALLPAINGFGGFVAKFNSDGNSLIYSTYLGGNNGNLTEAHGIAVDRTGNAYVTGLTNAPDFPTENGLQNKFLGGPSDLFITKLNPRGTTLVYSTFLGGSREDTAAAITVDESGYAFITGRTASLDFPLVNSLQNRHAGGKYDAFFAKLAVDGRRLIYSSYYGGKVDDEGTGITIDRSGNAYLVGATTSPNLVLQKPAQRSLGGKCKEFCPPDLFILKLNATGNSLQFASYLGGLGSDYGFDIVVDNPGNIYVTGQSSSSDMPITPGAVQEIKRDSADDSFVTKFTVLSLKPVVKDIFVQGKKIYVSGVEFEQGATILINDRVINSINDDQTPVNLLIGKGPRALLRPGATIKVVVKNANGNISPIFEYKIPL